MGYIFICPKCLISYQFDSINGEVCPTCGVDTIYSNYDDEQWSRLKVLERTMVKNKIAGNGVALTQTPNKPRSSKLVSKDTHGVVYSIDGVRGRHIDVYEDRCVITVKVGVGSFLTGNVSDGEKTIYYADCIGVQFKRAGLQIGYLQLETASGLMNNRQNNFFNENSFTFDTTKVSNEKMDEVAEYVKSRITAYKQAKTAPAAAVISPADEIKKYKELLDMGIITQEEFNIKKHQLLGL